MTHAHESIYRCLGGMAPVRELAALCPPQGGREKLPEPVIREEARHSVTMSEPFWRGLPGFMNEWAGIFQWGGGMAIRD